MDKFRFTLIGIACLLSAWSATVSAAPGRLPAVIRSVDMNAAVSLMIDVTADGSIEGTMQNNTGRKIGDVEVLVAYAWIWAQDFNHGDDNPGWSMTYTLPVELAPGASVPMNLAPLHPLTKRDDGHFLISAKVVGYTRYRWVTPADQP